jgi:hypothetical protein
MFAFYAFFLIFGENKTVEDQIQVSENSIKIEVHLNHSSHVSNPISLCYYYKFSENTPTENFDIGRIKQKRKYFEIAKRLTTDYPEFSLYSRPPPELA